MEKLTAKAREMNNDQINEALAMIGGGFVSVDARMARAAILEVYCERFGETALDAKMEEMGM